MYPEPQITRSIYYEHGCYFNSNVDTNPTPPSDKKFSHITPQNCMSSHRLFRRYSFTVNSRCRTLPEVIHFCGPFLEVRLSGRTCFHDADLPRTSLLKSYRTRSVTSFPNSTCLLFPRCRGPRKIRHDSCKRKQGPYYFSVNSQNSVLHCIKT